MDDIKRPKLQRENVRRTDYLASQQRPVVPVRTRAPHKSAGRVFVRLRFKRPHLRKLQPFFKLWKNFWVRMGLIGSVALLVAMELIIILQPYLVNHTYALGAGASALLQKSDSALADKLQFDATKGDFNYNAGYNPMRSDGADQSGGPQISATANVDASKGLTVTDPFNQIDFSITPQFRLLPGKQDGNRIVYPLGDGTGWLVYTMQVGSVKEDVVLSHANGNNMSLTYKVKVDSQLAVRKDVDGSIGIYGSDSPLTGSVTTGSASDAALLQKARQHMTKNKLFFSMPAPVAYGANETKAAIDVHYDLKDSMLTTVATNLKKGSYPLTIDPTVTVTSTSDLFRDTNPDSNADLNASTGNIQRGAVTGGVIPAWTNNTNSITTSRFLNGGTIYDDYAYVAGGAGANSTSNLNAVQFARLSTSGSCGTSCIGAWATTTALPASLSRFTLLAYNGYLYAIGGATSTTNCATDSNAIYYNRIQVNGQLSATWNTATAILPAAVCGMGANAYNGKIYAGGGRTGSATNTGVTTLEYATINPDGNLSSFTTDDSTLPAARFDMDLRVYNGYVYLIGGNLNGTLTNSVIYAPLATDGSVYGTGTGSWKTASSFGTARSNMGASFTATNDGYMYVQGGCSAYTSDSCTAVRSEVQTAQINADGTLGPWSDVATSIASLSRVGNSIVQWRGTIYSMAGCTGMNAGAVSCVSGNTLATQSYSKISTPGQVGPVNTTTVLPTARWAHGSVVNGGFIYVVGGCITASCQSGSSDTTGATSYATLNADGTIGAWTTDSTHLLNGATGLAAMGMTVYNNVIYATGGYTFGGPSSSVYYISVNSSTGALNTGGWTTQANKLGTTTTYNSAVAYRDFLFVFGGCINSTNGAAGCNTYRNSNYRMPIGAAGAPGTLTTSAATGNFLNLPTGKGLMAPALYNGYIYLSGGATSAVGQTNLIYYARITDSGFITAWNTATGTLAHNLRRADAIAMNGYLYVVGGHDGGGPTTYGDIEIAKINMATGNIDSNFTNSVIQVTPRWDERAVFSNGYVYVSGGCAVGDPPAGCNASTGVSNVMEYVEIFNAGNKGTSTWSNGSNVYPTPSGNLTSVATTAYNGYIYMAGGCNSYTVGSNFATPLCNTGTNGTAYAQLNPDGTIGTWSAGPNLTASNTRDGGCLAQVGGYLYFVAGEDNAGNAIATVEYSQIGANGVPGAWNQATNGIPAVRAWHGCATFGNRIYVTGGMNLAGAEQTSVYYSPDLTAGGDITSAWGTGTSFTGIRAHHTTAIIGGYLFVMGGDNGTSALYDVQSIGLDPSTGNTSGSWQYSREMPQGISYQAVVGANGYIYLFGGRTAATACVANTYIASVNSTGRLSGWSQAVNKFTTARFGAGAAYYNGYYYLLGGNNCTSIISSNIIQYGGQQSQAMKTLISKYADFNGDGVPLSFVGYLTNAVNNGVDIEAWRMQYKASMEGTNSWGAATSIYPLVDESNNPVTSLDGSSTNVKLARWFYMSFDINMEQSFTFTDDTQPSISQYELYYTPPPAKRLMHGKDFRDQTQQDLEAHP
jgi:N-acetylneuraminic acid mutarotase